MTKRGIYIYMAATCSMAVVTPGRFAIGLVISIELILLTTIGILFRALLKILKLKELNSTVQCSLLITLTIAFKMLLGLYDSVLSLQLSFLIYLPTISTFSSVFLFQEENLPLKQELKTNMIPSAVFSLFILFVSAIRDIFGYGTFTLPAPGQMKEIIIFPENMISAGTFLATIPGALVICACFLGLFLKAEQKIKILENAGGLN